MQKERRHARVVTFKGVPNVLLIMTHDQSYGVTGTFGGVMQKPYKLTRKIERDTVLVYRLCKSLTA